MPPATPGDPFALAGWLLDRKYRVDRAVAEGGFGVVYKGHHLALDTPIAIKVLTRATGAGDDAFWDAVTQFLDEARTVAKLRHPAVVSVLDSGMTEVEGKPVAWMVMEWLDGETLRAHLVARRGEGGRSRAEVLTLMRPVLEALACAHEAGIAHRDLKASNVMLVPSRSGPTPRVLDFGIAKLMDRDEAASGDASANTTRAATRAFSPSCAAPEQLAGKRTGPWTDVYAAALLIVELLTDAPAYPEGDDESRYRAAFDARRPTPATNGVDVGSWEPVLARALAVKSADRFPDAATFLAALDAALIGRPRVANESVHEAPTDSPVTSSRFASTAPDSPPRRRAWIAAAVLGAGVVALLFGLRGRDRDRANAAVASSASTAVAPPARLCESNAACTRASGAPAICRPAIGCVPLASPDCKPLVDARALERDDVVLVGTMFPTSAESDVEFARSNENAVELARRDFAQILAGLQSGGRVRPIGVVACDDAVDPARAAAHLVDRVGVPAIIGFKGGVEAIDLATSLFLQRGVLAIAALTTNPLVTAVPHPMGFPRLVWRTTYNGAEVAAAMSAFVAGVVERELRASSLGRTGTMRVALVRPANAVGAAISNALFRSLRFNGKGALDNGYDFREMTYPIEATANGPELAKLVTEILAFGPHAVLHLGGTTSFVDGVLTPIETGWVAPQPRPRFIGSALLSPAYLKLIGRSVDRRRRHVGFTTASSTPANARFVMHYNETFTPKITRTNAPNSSYDAFYLLAYSALTVLPGQPVDGAALARGFARLVPVGRRIEAGIEGIFDAYTTLHDGQTIDFDGATGKLDFDLATGESAFDQVVVCAAIDKTGDAFDGIESGLVYVAERKRLEGTMNCP